MTIEKTCVQCDGCKNHLDTGLVSFERKIKKIKIANWSIRKIAGVWRHYCSDCTEQQKSNSCMTRTPVDVSGYWWNRD